MNATKLAKALLLLSLGLGSVALALHRDNTDRRDEFVVDAAFRVLNWHYSDKGDEKATAQGIQDWLDRYFTS